MLDVRPTAYVAPLDEQEIGPLTPIIHVENLADENATITGTVRIYRESLGTLLYTSVLHPGSLTHGTYADFSAETPFNPGAIADDDYFILAEIVARSTLTGNSETVQLGQFYFDIKTAPMGPVPATHGTTHEDGGMDEIDLTGLSGILGDLQPVDAHATSHQKGESDALEIANLGTAVADDTLVLAPDGAGGVEFRAEVAAVADILDLPTAEMDDTLVLAPDGAGGVEFRAEVGGAGTSDTPQTLTDQAAIDWDLSAGGAAQVTLAGDRTLNAPTNMVDGARYRLKVIQDGTGTRLLTWNAIYRFPGGVHPCLSAAVNNIDILTFDCDGTYMDCTGMVSALS